MGGVRLGMTKDDVLFEKGEPDRKVDEKDVGRTWAYGPSERPEVIVLYDNGTVGLIIGTNRYDSVSGIRILADSDRVIAKFGEPIITGDGATRLYDYPRYNVQFLLEKREATHIVVKVFHQSD